MTFKRWILKVHLPQETPSGFNSSLLSPQSSCELHIKCFLIHFPLLHWNSPIFSHVPGFPEIRKHTLIIASSSKECWHTSFDKLLILTYSLIKLSIFYSYISNQHNNDKKQIKKNGIWRFLDLYLNYPRNSF